LTINKKPSNLAALNPRKYCHSFRSPEVTDFWILYCWKGYVICIIS